MALYIPHSIFNLARLLYVRPETFGPYYVNIRKKLAKRYIWNVALYGAEMWTLQKIDQKYLGDFEVWCWSWMAKISWTDRVKNVEIIHRVKEERNILHTITWRMTNCIGHILCTDCILKRLIEGKIGGTGNKRKKA